VFGGDRFFANGVLKIRDLRDAACEEKVGITRTSNYLIRRMNNIPLWYCSLTNLNSICKVFMTFFTYYQLFIVFVTSVFDPFSITIIRLVSLVYTWICKHYRDLKTGQPTVWSKVSSTLFSYLFIAKKEFSKWTSKIFFEGSLSKVWSSLLNKSWNFGPRTREFQYFITNYSTIPLFKVSEIFLAVFLFPNYFIPLFVYSYQH